MKVLIIIFFLCINFNLKTYSQSKPDKISTNVVFIEIAGLGGYGSLNYEKLLARKNKFRYTARIGLSTYRIRDFTNKFNPDIILPITANALFGNNHKIEIGVGKTYTNIVRANSFDFKPNRSSEFTTIFSFGYRYQKNTPGLLYRCAYTPILSFNNVLRHWLGVSLGYSF